MKTISFFCVSMLFLLTACTQSSSGEGRLRASGIVEATDIAAAAELPGRVVEVYVAEGDSVAAGDPLFRLDDSLLQAQRSQAAAAMDTVRANLAMAETGLSAAESAKTAAELGVEAARLQLEQALTAARAAEQPGSELVWGEGLPEEIELPGWYFQKNETMEAARAALEAAVGTLESERQGLELTLEEAGGRELLAAETRVARAQAAFLVAADLRAAEEAQNPGEAIGSYVQDLYDSALAELDAAQLAYDQILSDEDAADVLEARARLSVAQERFDLARDRMAALRTGEESLEVQAARLGVRQAEIGVESAEAARLQAQIGVELGLKALAEAQAALDALDLQISKMTVRSAVSGVVLTRNVELGEVLSPGVTVLTLGLLDELTITVYIPEDRYGEVALGDTASVTVDSFPGRTFRAEVARIADQAEFTPRNVQTQEERVTTVYAVFLKVLDGAGELKPGMPADVSFGD